MISSATNEDSKKFGHGFLHDAKYKEANTDIGCYRGKEDEESQWVVPMDGKPCVNIEERL